MANNKLDRKEILNALAVHNQLPGISLTKPEYRAAKSLLSKHITIADAFDIFETLTLPYNREVTQASKQASINGMVLDKIAKHLKVPKEKLNKFWNDAEDELHKANQNEIKKMKAKLKESRDKLKKKAQK